MESFTKIGRGRAGLGSNIHVEVLAIINEGVKRHDTLQGKGYIAKHK